MALLHSLGRRDLGILHKNRQHRKDLAHSYSRDEKVRTNPRSPQAECHDHIGTDVVVARRESSDRL